MHNQTGEPQRVCVHGASRYGQYLIAQIRPTKPFPPPTRDFVPQYNIPAASRYSYITPQIRLRRGHDTYLTHTHGRPTPSSPSSLPTSLPPATHVFDLASLRCLNHSPPLRDTKARYTVLRGSLQQDSPITCVDVNLLHYLS